MTKYLAAVMMLHMKLTVAKYRDILVMKALPE